MYPASSPNKHLTWTREGFLISTDPALIDIKALNTALGSDYMYWAKELPEDVLRTTLENSLNFGLYDTSNSPNPANEGDPSKPPPLVGFSRIITDNVTFGYLTDVYILEEYRGRGLGEWLCRSVQETMDAMPYLRRTTAILGDQGLAKWYEKHMGMKLVEAGSGMWFIQRRGNGSSFG